MGYRIDPLVQQDLFLKFKTQPLCFILLNLELIKYLQILLFLLSATLLSCSDWEKTERPSGHFSKLVILNDSTAIGVGVATIEANVHQSISIISKTSNKSQTWINTYSGVGKVSAIATAQNTLYVMERYPNQEFYKYTSRLLSSEDEGESWREVSNIDYEINEMVFRDSLNGICNTFYPTRKTLKTQDGGITWQEIKGFPSWRQCVVAHNCYYFMDQSIFRKVFKTNFELKNMNNVLSGSDITKIKCDNNNNVWVLCRYSDYISLFKIDPNKNTEIIKIPQTKGLKPRDYNTYFHVFNENIYVINKDGLGDSNYLFHSINEGLSFGRSLMPDDTFNKPVGFWGNSIWFEGTFNFHILNKN